MLFVPSQKTPSESEEKKTIQSAKKVVDASELGKELTKNDSEILERKNPLFEDDAVPQKDSNDSNDFPIKPKSERAQQGTLDFPILPAYTQHPNGCGLASLLMLVDPPRNEEFQKFLVQSWEIISPLFGKPEFRQKELQWALALQYYLLKSLAYDDLGGKDRILEFYNDRMEWVFEDQRIMNRFIQEQNHQKYLDKKKNNEAYTFLPYIEGSGLVTPLILMQNIHTMKTDVELKVLAEIFNLEFKYQDGEDITGAIYFLEKEISKKIGINVKKKWLLLEKLSKEDDYKILYGRYHHWLAINGFYRVGSSNSSEKWVPKEMIIDLNDPASAHRTQLKFNHLQESDRFYVFKLRNDATFEHITSFLEMAEEEIPKDLTLWKDYLQKREKERLERLDAKKSANRSEKTLGSIPPSIKNRIKDLEDTHNENKEQMTKLLEEDSDDLLPFEESSELKKKKN